MWKMMEKPKTVLASPSLVKEFVEMEPAPHDRPLSERRMQVYQRILKAGNFRPVTWASVMRRSIAGRRRRGVGFRMRSVPSFCWTDSTS